MDTAHKTKSVNIEKDSTMDTPTNKNETKQVNQDQSSGMDPTHKTKSVNKEKDSNVDTPRNRAATFTRVNDTVWCICSKRT